jgi:hypothetical protein
MITHAHPRTPTDVRRSVCAIGYGSYMKNASTSDGSLSNVPPTCHVLPKSGPNDSCHCVACPHGYGSRGGAINRAECIPLLHFYVRLVLTTTEATPACNPAVSVAVTQALADALSKNHDILPGDSSADFLGCCSDSQVCWHEAGACVQYPVFTRGRAHVCAHKYTTHVCTHTHNTHAHSSLTRPHLLIMSPGSASFCSCPVGCLQTIQERVWTLFSS